MKSKRTPFAEIHVKPIFNNHENIQQGPTNKENDYP